MAVVFDAQSTPFFGDGVSSLSDSSLTIGSGTNRALVVLVSISGNISALTAVTWGGVSLTQLAVSTQGFDSATFIFGLLNPASGAQTLALSWTSTQQVSACGVSFTGVEQSSFAAAFTGVQNTIGATGPATATVVSAVGDIVVACESSVLTPLTPNNTSIYTHQNLGGMGGAGHLAAGAPTVVMSATQSAPETWAESAINVHAAATVQTRAAHIPKVLLKQYAQVALPYNLALYSPQVPFRPYDWAARADFIPQIPAPQQPYNQSLYTVTITLMGQAWI